MLIISCFLSIGYFRMSQHISSCIVNVLAPLFKKKGEHIVTLMNNWEKVATSKWSNVVFPHKLIWDNNNQAVLILSSNNHLVEKLVLHDKHNIINNANYYFGYNCIINIKFSK